MIRPAVAALLSGLAITAAQARAPAPPPPATESPSRACEQAIADTERKQGIAKGLLAAIGMVETGQFDPVLHRAAPWPWSVNVDGQSHVFATKLDAMAAVVALVAQGARSIDVGCVQINLAWHPDAFKTLDEAFDPAANVAYGGRFLKALYGALGTWEAAAGAFHSRTPVVAEPYQQRVMALWIGAPLPLPPTPAAPAAQARTGEMFGPWPPASIAFASGRH